jgi:hypothetical protein
MAYTIEKVPPSALILRCECGGIYGISIDYEDGKPVLKVTELVPDPPAGGADGSNHR